MTAVLSPQVVLITLLLGHHRDVNPGVRAACARALGVLILFPCLYEDDLFVVDMIDETLNAMKDENNAVRMKAVWALANAGDALVSIVDRHESGGNKSTTDSTRDIAAIELPIEALRLVQCIRAGLTASKESDKNRFIVVSALVVIATNS